MPRGKIKRFNTFEILPDGKTVKIELQSKKYGIKFGYCDLEDWERCKHLTWYPHKASYDKMWYIECFLLKIENGKRRYSSTSLHKMIMQTKSNEIVNHKDFDGLNCRKTNLEVCTKLENSRYRRISKNNTSGYKGVYWDKKCDKWCSRITIRVEGKEKRIYLGWFDDKIEAAKTYNEAALKYYENFAKINEILN